MKYPHGQLHPLVIFLMRKRLIVRYLGLSMVIGRPVIEKISQYSIDVRRGPRQLTSLLSRCRCKADDRVAPSMAECEL